MSRSIDDINNKEYVLKKKSVLLGCLNDVTILVARQEVVFRSQNEIQIFLNADNFREVCRILITELK